MSVNLKLFADEEIDPYNTTREGYNGFIKRIFFSNLDTGYGSFLLETPYNTYKVVGNYFDPDLGEFVECLGNMSTHPKFGDQLDAMCIRPAIPPRSTAETKFRKYLASYPNIRKKDADHLMHVLGKNTLFDFLEGQRVSFGSYEELDPDVLRHFKNGYAYVQGIQEISEFLAQHSIEVSFAKKLWKTFGDKTIKALQSNPYRLSSGFGNISFKAIDEIALKLGIPKDSSDRSEAACAYILKEGLSEGHTYLPLPLLLNNAEKLLDLKNQPRIIVEGLKSAKKAQTVSLVKVEETHRVYLNYVLEIEKYCQESLLELNKPLDITQELVDQIHQLITEFKQSTSLDLSDEQVDAVKLALTSSVLILTGNPGTGKTTVCKCILYLFNKLGHTYELASPTGRAAKRLAEVTGTHARTIHRLLEYSPEEGGGFTINEENPLQTDFVLVDEFSMVDTFLLKSLLAGIKEGTRLIMVGDPDQLPSVQAGNVLKDLITCDKFTKTHLSKIYRQDDSNLIVLNAHAINKGVDPKLLPYNNENEKSSDFLFVEIPDTHEALEQIQAIYEAKLYEGYTPNHIQILTPKKDGICGVKNINKVIQAQVNGDSFKKHLTHGDTVFRLHDRVIQMQNDYTLGVFNGDTGVIKDIDTEESILYIDFGGLEPLSYPKEKFIRLQLAYAMTIHKSQGSEYPVVIMPLLAKEHYIMLYRNLFYTGITRAKKKLYLVGETKAVTKAVKNVKSTLRFTGLFK